MRPSGKVAATLLVVLLGCGGSEAPTVSTVTNSTSSVATSIVISGSRIIVNGKTTQLTALARNASGTEISGKTFTWSSTTESVATVASDGLVTARAEGTTTISASADGKAGTLIITVGPAPAVVASVTVSGALTVQTGATTKLTAVPKDAAGVALAVTPVWSSSDSTIVSVDADGVASAQRIGSVVITATAGSSSGTFTLTSQLTPFTFAFDAGVSPADQQFVKDVFPFAYPITREALTLFFTCSSTIPIPGCLPFTLVPTIGATKVSGVLTSPLCDARVGNAAYSDATSITICMGSARWRASGPVSRQRIVAHELHHRFQPQWNKANGQPDGLAPEWMFEGMAELMGASALAARGLLSMDVWRSCSAAEITAFAKQQPPGIPALATLEAYGTAQGTPGPLYAAAAIAMDQLLTSRTLYTLHSWVNSTATLSVGNTWQSTFATTFKQSIADFYAGVPAYVNSIPAPQAGACNN